MKKVLITGANSYIGTSFEKYINDNYPNDYEIETIDMIDISWLKKDFSKYDVVIHVAGFVHHKETKKNKELYYKVNRDLAIEVAKKAKIEGVFQFIFFSSMSVYGKKSGQVNRNTIPVPKSNYGKSKLQAEFEIERLKSENFKICVLRPPMIYGKGCKGNFPKLVDFANKTSIFPDLKNKRSMLYIDNLSIYLKHLIDANLEGLFFPQNKEYLCTTEIVRIISKEQGKRIWFTKLFNWFIYASKQMIGVVNKLFSDLYYVQDDNICLGLIDNEESIRKSSVKDV